MNRGSNSGGSNAGQSVLVVVGVLVLAVLFLLFSSFHIVPPGHRGVRVTLGSVAQDVVNEGVTFKLPLGITQIRDITIQQQTATGEAQCFSSDTQSVMIRFAVMYRINADKVATLFQNFRGDPYASIIEPRLQEALKQETALVQVEQMVQQRETLRSKTLERLKARMTENGGIVDIVDVNIMNIDLSDEVERAIEAKMVIEQEAKKKDFEKQRETTEAEITLIKAKAEAEAARVRGEALLNNPLVLQMEIIKKWNGISPNVVVLGQDGAGGAQVILPVTSPSQNR